MDEATAARALPAETTNVLVVGVGGQGVIMVSKVLAALCQGRGLAVKQSEVHGMAKRGGAVFSHVRFGAEVWSPTIARGKAHVLVALEWAEALRWLDHLDPRRGILIADTKRIVPPFACRDRRAGAAPAYVGTPPAEIIERVAQGYAIDAAGIAGRHGNARAANAVLLGALSVALPFSVEEWLAALTAFVPPTSVAVNRAAFMDGRAWVAEPHPAESPAPAPPVPAPEVGAVALDITAAWCKGCDICVKVCPERCLVLNERQVAELADADACTGCRLCEWLCPDFAIRVRHLEPVAAAS